MTLPPALRAPSLLLAAGALAGVTAASAQSWPEYSAGIFTAVAALFIFRNMRGAVAVFAAAFGLVYLSAMADRPPETVLSGEPVQLRARIESARCGERSQRAIATVCGRETPFRLELTLTDLTPELFPGDIVELHTTLRPADRYAHIPHTRMVAQTARAARVSACAVLTPADIRIAGRANGLRYRSEELRRTLADALFASRLAPEVSRTLAAACLGGDYLGGDELHTYRSAGLAHLFCVSGFHVGVLAGFIGVLLWPLRLWRGSRGWHRPLMLLCVWLYAAVTGFSPSVMRAAAMITCYFAARAMQRGNTSVNALCLAFFAVLLLSPYSLYSAGFQLSFAAATSLLLFARRLNPVPERHTRLHSAAALLAVPLAAMLGTMPVMLVWFHSVPLTSVPANAMAALLFAPLIYAGMASVVTGWEWLASLSRWLHRLLDGTAAFWADINDSMAYSPPASTVAVAALVVALAALAALMHMPGWKARSLAAGVGVIGVLVSACAPTGSPEGGLYADSAGTGTVLLAIDGGKACRIVLDGGKAEASTLAFDNICRARGIVAESSPGGDFDLGTAKRTGSRIEVCGLSIAVADKEAPLPGAADILFVSRTYRGDFEQCAEAVRPRAVLLSASAPAGLRARVADACRRRGLAYHNLLMEAADLSFATSAE
ncbi:MAG: ComEC/Rec2 family competence protein [Muribaculaceae bacterium]|nr:ComEC/Rec2 family competence protein [Muribaculaceae bacterium]